MTRHAGTAGGVFDPPAAPRDQIRRRAAPGAYWRSPPGLVMLAATGLALAVRLYLLGRPGYLTGITEYDDGVYLGGAISLLAGTVPYHDFAFVQPPGILLLMAPAAVVAKVSAPAIAMAAARLLTAAASAACVGLAGALVRHRGTVATLVACGVLALYPDDIMSAHTLLLEPWMNLLVLSGTCAAFRDGAFRDGAFGGSAFRGGRLAPPPPLLWAGVLFGLACAVKYWAVIPAACVIAVCLCARPDDGPGEVPPTTAGQVTGDPAPVRPGTARRTIAAAPLRDTPVNGFLTTRQPSVRAGRAAWFAVGLVAGFAVPVLPFAVRWPGLFLRSTVLDQASRTGSAVPESLRLAHLTGLATVLNDAGQLTVSGNEGTLFARADVAAAATWATGWLPTALAVAFAVLLCLGYAVGRTRGRRTQPGRVPAVPANTGNASERANCATRTDTNSASDRAGRETRTDTDSTDERADRETQANAGTQAETAAKGPGPFEIFALAVLGCTLAAVLGYSAFFYHYADLPAPWLAIAAGYTAAALRGSRLSANPRRDARTARLLPAALRGALTTWLPTALRGASDTRHPATGRWRSRRPGWQHGASQAKRHGQEGLIVWLAVGLVLVAAFEAWELSGLRAPSVNADAALITPGACVVSDEISLAIAADRFTAGSGGCPDVLDSLAATLVAGNGVSVEGGAQALPRVAAYWQAIFSRARYVWLSGSSDRRIPWTSGLRAWFARNFKPLHPPAGQHSEGQVYVRRA